MLVSLLINGALLAVSDDLQTFLPGITVIVFNVLHIVVGFVVITLLFSVIFQGVAGCIDRLAGCKLRRYIYGGAFYAGQAGNWLEASSSATSSTYGAAGSLIALLLWVYYTTVILYFGAEFTRAYADFTGKLIHPAEYAGNIIQKEDERNVAVNPKKAGKRREERNRAMARKT